MNYIPTIVSPQRGPVLKLALCAAVAVAGAPLQGQVAREYIYMGGRAIAVEQPNVGAVSIEASCSAGPVGPAETRNCAATVTGTSNVAVNWRLASGVGSISASGVYASPTVVASATMVQVVATAVADQTKMASVMLDVRPLLSATELGPLPSGGGVATNAFYVTRNSAWQAASNVTWITNVQPLTASAPGWVTFSYAGNTETTERTGTLTVAGQTFSVKQAGSGSVLLEPSKPPEIPSSGGSGNVVVSGTPGWTVSDVPGWLTVTTSGNLITYHAAPNPGAARNASLGIGGARLAITQEGCGVSLSPPSAVFSDGGAGSGTIVVLTNCASVAVQSSDAWIRVTTPTVTAPSGTASYQIDGNFGSTKRDGVINVGGVPFPVTQYPHESYELTPTSVSLYPGYGWQFHVYRYHGGIKTDVTSQTSWSITPELGAQEAGFYRAPFSLASNSTATLSATIAGRPAMTATIQLIVPDFTKVTVFPLGGTGGMENAFNTWAEFSGMTPGTDLEWAHILIAPDSSSTTNACYYFIQRGTAVSLVNNQGNGISSTPVQIRAQPLP